jgi:hypothetical protein
MRQAARHSAIDPFRTFGDLADQLAKGIAICRGEGWDH